MSLFICPDHGLHHGPFCCDKPQEWWDGSFSEEKIMDDNNSGIHPAPVEFSEAQIAADPVLHFFHYAHLPPKLQETSKAFFLLAHHIVRTVPRSAERTVALRKLLEGKDAAVRANLPIPAFAQPKRPLASVVPIGEPVETGGHDQDRDGPIPFEQ